MEIVHGYYEQENLENFPTFSFCLNGKRTRFSQTTKFKLDKAFAQVSLSKYVCWDTDHKNSTNTVMIMQPL